MADSSVSRFNLDSVRTDGWFERIGNSIGSFQALCEIVGERFFAFSIIVGARITALTVDRKSPQQTLVDFVVGAESELEPQRLTLADFRRRLVGALLVDDDIDHPRPERDTDIEAVQLFLGVRYLLLAPLYGYSLVTLRFDKDIAHVELLHDGEEMSFELDVFRRRIRSHVHDELERSSQSARSAIDLARVAEAEALAERGEWAQITQLLGAWPAPLAIFLRTPEGQVLAGDTRALIAKGLGILGSACVELDEMEQAEEVFRIGIQYAQEGLSAADLFRRLGAALVESKRPGEAIGPLRRALAFGGQAAEIYPVLGRAFLHRKRFVAAYACFRKALAEGAPADLVKSDMSELESSLGPALNAWQADLTAAAN